MPKPDDIRRTNLRKIVERETLAVTARRMNKPDRQISDMISDPPRKAFGEKVARSMEAAYDPTLPPGWLDKQQSAPPVLLLTESAAQYGVRQQAAVLAITSNEFALLSDLRELPPDERDRHVDEIRRKADKVRANRAKRIGRIVEARAERTIAAPGTAALPATQSTETSRPMAGWTVYNGEGGLSGIAGSLADRLLNNPDQQGGRK